MDGLFNQIQLSELSGIAAALGTAIALLQLFIRILSHRIDRKHGDLARLAVAMERDFSDGSPEDIILMEETLSHYYKGKFTNSIYQVLRLAPDRARALRYWRYVSSAFEVNSTGTMLRYVSGNRITHSKKLGRVSVGISVILDAVLAVLLLYFGLVLLAIAGAAALSVTVSGLTVGLAWIASMFSATGIVFLSFAYLFFDRSSNLWLYRGDFLEAVGPLLDDKF